MISDKILRVTCLPTVDFPASGITSHELVQGTSDILAIPFPSELCLHDYSAEQLVLDCNVDLRDSSGSQITRFFASVYYSFRVSRYIEKNDISVIHIHWVPLLFIALFSSSNKKFVLTIHGEDARYLKKGFFRYLATKMNKIFVVGTYWTSVLKEAGLTVEEIPNFSPIDKTIFDSSAISRSKRNAEEKGNIVKLCVVGAEKDHKNLGIFENLPDEFFEMLKDGKATLDFVGVTPQYLNDIGVSKSSMINCHGRCSRKKTLEIISNSTLLLIPSFSEGNPKVVWEAIEFKVMPIISSSLTFYGYYHVDYPYKFDPTSGESFWDAIKLGLADHADVNLDDYFTISERDHVRTRYEQSYSNGE